MNVFPKSEFEELAIKKGHSKEFLELTEKYINNLFNNGYPVIFSLKHLSEILNISYGKLNYIINCREFCYINYEISKKSGGKRLLTCPNLELKGIQKWIYENILKNYTLHKSCIGFRRGMSIKDNAKMHVNQECILKIDLTNFFYSINEKRVYKTFKEIGYHPNLAVYFAQLLTVNISEIIIDNNIDFDRDYKFLKKEAVLPQGSPASPVLANIVATKLDNRLFNLSKTLGINYSRYADDITFSGDRESMPSLKVVNKIINECGFFINYKKVRYCYKKQGQIVTGLSVVNGVKVPKKFKKETDKHLHYCNTLGVSEHLSYLKKKNNFNKSGFREWLLGRIYFIYSVEPDVGKKMLKEFDSINWLI